MLIIFDLDDTLIKTSELITPWRFKQVLDHLQEVGLLQNASHSLLNDLIEKHSEYSSSQEALGDLFKKSGIDDSIIQEAAHKLNAYDPDIPVSVFSGVYQLLNKLKKEYQLALVTSGTMQIQNLKIQKSDLTNNYFDFIEIVEGTDKKTAYQNIFNSSNNQKVIVVGDRIVRDLLPAKNLGFTTVLVRQGRGKHQKINKDQVDFVIDDVTEVENLIKSIENPYNTQG